MDYYLIIDHGPEQDGLRLSIMFVVFLVTSYSLWLLLRQEKANHDLRPMPPTSRRLRRLLLVGGISILCSGFMWLVYVADPPPDEVTTVFGKPATVAILPISHWGFGVSDIEVFDRTSDRSSSCSSEVRGACFRFGFLEYRQFEWPPPCVNVS